MRTALDAADSNPLTGLFRQSYQAFYHARGALVREAAAPAVSAAKANEAAQDMLATLRDITSELHRNASLRLPQTDEGEVKLLVYTFVGVVDEVLLNSAWLGASVWDSYLLEKSVFKTQLAGSRLPKMANTVLARPASRRTLEIAALYLDCFNLGFRGDFRDKEGGAATLAKLRANLFAFVYQHEERIAQPDSRLSEPAQLHVVTTVARERSLGRRVAWYALPLAALAIYLLVSGALWMHLRRPIAAIVGTPV